MAEKITFGEEKLTFNELAMAKMIAVLGDIKEAVLKVLDFYTTREKEDTIAEVYNITAKPTEGTLHAPIFKNVRMHWYWLQIDNFHDSQDLWIGINGDSSSGIKIGPLKTKTISYSNLKVDYIRYKTKTKAADIQIICMRPRYHGR